MHSLLPMAHSSGIVFGGRDINSGNLADTVKCAKVLDYNLQRQFYPFLHSLVLSRSVYCPYFVVSNQENRANTVLKRKDERKHLENLRENIQTFKRASNLDKTILLWTATIERFSEEFVGVRNSANNLLDAIDKSQPEVLPLTLFALA